MAGPQLPFAQSGQRRGPHSQRSLPFADRHMESPASLSLEEVRNQDPITPQLPETGEACCCLSDLLKDQAPLSLSLGITEMALVVWAAG